MVAAAWDFDKIEERYREAIAVMDQFEAVANTGSGVELSGWMGEMRLAWRSILTLDPLLPAELLPTGYSGRDAWRRHRAIFAEAARRIASLPRGEAAY